MEQDTPPGSLVVPAEQMEADIEAIAAILRRRGPEHARKLRELLEALTETWEARQSER